MTDPTELSLGKRITMAAKMAKRFVFGQSQLYSSWGYMNPDEPTERTQRTNYRGLFFKCVNVRAKETAKAMQEAKVVRVMGPNEYEEVEWDHPWNQRLQRPVSKTQTVDFWEWAVLSRDLLGHAHSLVSEWESVMGSRLPAGFLPIYSEFGDLNPVPNARGGVDAWEYLRSDGKKFRYDTEEVLAFRRTSPYNPYKTMSLIQAAAMELDIDFYMKQYRKASVKDGGITSDIISTDQQMNSTQRDKLSQEFKQFKGQRGQDKVLALSHGMELVKDSMDARDLQFIEGHIQNKNDIYYITGVPEALFAMGSNRAESESAERVMKQYTIQPIVDSLCKQLTTEFEKIYEADEGVLMVMPPEVAPIDEEIRIKRRESYLRTGQRTIDEYRQEDGLEEYSDGIGSVPLVSFSQSPLRDVVTLNDEFEPAPTEDSDRSVKKKHTREVDREYEWRVIDKHRQREEKKTASSVNRVFDLMEERALDSLDSKRSTRAEEPVLSVNQILNLFEARQIVDEELRDDIIRLIKEGFERGAFNAGASGLEFQMSTPQVRNLLREVAGKTRGIADTTIDQLSDSLEAGIKEGESIDDLSERVSKYFKNAKATRTRMIAQTMTTSSFEGGQLISFKNAGATGKSWLSQRDGNVRKDHEIADRTQNEIGLNEHFQVGGEKLLHPGDPSASASQVVMCRCSMLPVMKGEDE